MKRPWSIIVVGLASAAIACSFFERATPASPPLPAVDASSVAPKGDRQFSMDVSPAADGDFDRVFQMMRDIGLERIGLFQNWDTLEPSPGTFDGQWLQIADLYYPANGVSLDLTLAVIHTNQSTAPLDLRDKPLDDPEVVRRFEALLDFAFAQLPNTDLRSVVVASEHDIYFGADIAKWEEFQEFYRQIAAYIHAARPGVAVATELTFSGLTGPMSATAMEVNAFSDLIGVSYYPMDESGVVRDPTDVGADMQALVKLYPDKPIVFYQAGYPSSERLESSEERQAEFVAEIFRAWDRHADRVPMIDFTWLHDASDESVRGFEEFYGLSGGSFREFLATLGLRTYDGRAKLAYLRLVEELEARGW